MTTITSVLVVIAIVALLVRHDKRTKALAEQKLRDTACGWIDELVCRGFSVREIAMNTGINVDHIEAWHAGDIKYAAVTRNSDIAHLIEMTMEARRAFVHVHQSVIADRMSKSLT